jgi:hypothetical protein
VPVELEHLREGIAGVDVVLDDEHQARPRDLPSRRAVLFEVAT